MNKFWSADRKLASTYPKSSLHVDVYLARQQLHRISKRHPHCKGYSTVIGTAVHVKDLDCTHRFSNYWDHERLPFSIKNYNRVKFKQASFKQTYAVQDVPQGPLVALRVVVKLAVAGAHFHFVFDALSNFLRQITQVTAAAQVWHVVLAHFRSLFVHKDLKCFDVPLFLKLMFSLLFFRHNLALSSIRIPTDPPLKLRRLILLNRDFCLCRFLLLAGLSEGWLWL